MRILFLTNYYPPSDQGWGYMQLCEEVADGLAAKGHQIAVLTSTRRDGPEIPRPYPVHRLLAIDPDWHGDRSAAWRFFVGRRQRERQAVADLAQKVESFRPHVIFIWHAIGLPRVLLQAAEQLAPTVYYLAGYLPELPDEYIAYWQAQPVRGSAQLLKRPVSKLALAMLHREGKPISLKYEYVICVSSYVRRRLVEQGLIPESAVVIYNGVDLSVFAPAAQPSWGPSSQVSCLVAGRVMPEKGVHTVIEAFTALPGSIRRQCRLTVLGDGPPDYVAALQTRVLAQGLGDVVTFQPPVSRSEMPATLRQYDILLLPSEYAEPIARSMQEAMAVGLLVIGTTTGGSGELLVHEQTGLVFEAGNAPSLAEQLGRAISDPTLASHVAAEGQARVCAAFSIDQTINKTERYLQGLLGTSA